VRKDYIGEQLTHLWLNNPYTGLSISLWERSQRPAAPFSLTSDGGESGPLTVTPVFSYVTESHTKKVFLSLLILNAQETVGRAVTASVVNMSLQAAGVGSSSLTATTYQSYPRDISEMQ
jgi:hypothetical protein